MKNSKYIKKKFDKDESVYLLNEYEDIVIEFRPLVNTHKCYAKIRGRQPYLLDYSTDLAVDTQLSEKVITKEDYDRW